MPIYNIELKVDKGIQSRYTNIEWTGGMIADVQIHHETTIDYGYYIMDHRNIDVCFDDQYTWVAIQ